MNNQTLEQRLSKTVDSAIFDTLELSNVNRLIPAEPLVRDDTKVMAQRIARKLTEALSQFAGELTEQGWREMTMVATDEALANDDPLKLRNEPKLAHAVADYTAYLVAPAGSDWALAAMADEDDYRGCNGQSSATWD
ncbi:MAG: hypothetical protein KIS67_25120 [Verrucomicrobiae bacterium]|nr:hypothetical protein [Verrucomicrobiae bacterium]